MSRDFRSRHHAAHVMRMEIGDRVRAAAAPGWSRLEVRRGQVGPYAVTTVLRDGHEIDAEGVDEPFQRMREVSYRGGRGTWVTCELVFTPGTRGYTGRVDAGSPPFETMPVTAVLAELTTYPREETPAWLLAASPTAVPIALPSEYGERYDLWRYTRGERPPRPPQINGPLSYVPDPAMTARSVTVERPHDRDLVRFRGAGDEVFILANDGRAYLLVRHGSRGIGEGLRSVAIDGAVLRLELDPKAADALEVETTFEVRLDDLPADRIDALRAGVVRVLEPCGVTLTGF